MFPFLGNSSSPSSLDDQAHSALLLPTRARHSSPRVPDFLRSPDSVTPLFAVLTKTRGSVPRSEPKAKPTQRKSTILPSESGRRSHAYVSTGQLHGSKIILIARLGPIAPAARSSYD